MWETMSSDEDFKGRNGDMKRGRGGRGEEYKQNKKDDNDNDNKKMYARHDFCTVEKRMKWLEGSRQNKEPAFQHQLWRASSYTQISTTRRGRRLSQTIGQHEEPLVKRIKSTTEEARRRSSIKMPYIQTDKHNAAPLCVCVCVSTDRPSSRVTK